VSVSNCCISQGSVATYLSCGGNYYTRFVGNFFLAWSVGRVLYLSAGQRTRTQSPRYCQISGADNASVHFPRSVASEQPRSKPSWLQNLGIVQQRVYQSRVHDVDRLKQRLLDVWHGMEQSVVDSTIDEWRVRLRACVRARGGHFERTLWLRQ